MPTPASGVIKCVHEVVLNLFGKGSPAVKDVKQGLIANCPLASLLAALAHTTGGRKLITNIVKEHAATVETSLAGIVDQLSDECKPSSNTIVTKRYFSVTLGSQEFEVSDVFYTGGGDRGSWSLLYMRTPTDVLWSAVIEKGYAKKEGGYQALDSATGKKLSLNEIWEVVTGQKPSGFTVDANTSWADVRKVAVNSGTNPAVAASKVGAKTLTGWHGHAILGVSGTSLRVYDPMAAKEKLVSLKVIREDIAAIFHSKI